MSLNSVRLDKQRSCIILAALASASFLWLSQTRGYSLYYGDAASHVNIARRIVDSRTPGYKQIGTVWLPLPHVLMAILVRDDSLWRSGLGGAIPGAVFFVAGVVFLYAAVRTVTESSAPAVVAAAACGLNPNLLYLQSTPMTEPLFFGCFAAAVFFGARFPTSRRLRHAVGAGVAILLATLTRYDGWFVLPFFALFFLLSRSWKGAAVFAAIASLGPVYWLAHNLYLYGDPLEFYRGPHSALAIFERGLAKGPRHPGDHDWRLAWSYYRHAMELVIGRPLVWAGGAGILAALLKKSTRPLILLALPVPFYLINIHSGGTPIFIPSLYPFSYYNTRYALAALPACAAGAAVLVALWPRASLRGAAAVAMLTAGLGGWLLRPSVENWICWKESEELSRGRRAWTRKAAEFFRRAYRPGDGIFTASGDVMAIYQAAGIPLRETLNDGNGVAFTDALRRPDLFLRERWVVAIAGDTMSFNLTNPRRYAGLFERVAEFSANREPVIEIYRKVK